MRTSIPRIRSVTDKATGRTIRVLPQPRPEVSPADVEDALQSALAAQDGRALGGYALVVWAKDGSSTCSLYAGPIPRALTPQFVKDRLLLETAKKWIAPLVDSDDAS